MVNPYSSSWDNAEMLSCFVTGTKFSSQRDPFWGGMDPSDGQGVTLGKRGSETWDLGNSTGKSGDFTIKDWDLTMDKKETWSLLNHCPLLFDLKWIWSNVKSLSIGLKYLNVNWDFWLWFGGFPWSPFVIGAEWRVFNGEFWGTLILGNPNILGNPLLFIPNWGIKNIVGCPIFRQFFWGDHDFVFFGFVVYAGDTRIRAMKDQEAYGGFLKQGYLQIIHCRLGLSIRKLSSDKGVPPWRAGNPHEYSHLHIIYLDIPRHPSF